MAGNTGLPSESHIHSDAAPSFENLFRQMPDGAVLLEPVTGRHVLCNPMAAQLLGYRHEDFAQQGLLDYEQGLTEAAWANRVARLQQEGWLAVNACYKTAQGGYIQIQGHLGLTSLAQKTLVYLVFRDCGTACNVSIAAQSQLNHLRALVEGVSDWLWEVDSDGRYTYVSPVVTSVLGYLPQEMLGKSPFDFMPAKERERVLMRYLNAVETRSPLIALENVNRHRDGHLVVLETSGAPIIDEFGVFRGYRGVDRDVSWRKRINLAVLSLSEIE